MKNGKNGYKYLGFCFVIKGFRLFSDLLAILPGSREIKLRRGDE